MQDSLRNLSLLFQIGKTISLVVLPRARRLSKIVSLGTGTARPETTLLYHTKRDFSTGDDLQCTGTAADEVPEV
jgi:hypothetical protein